MRSTAKFSGPTPWIKFIGMSPEPRRIIAVVPDIDDENIIPAPAMTIYQPVDQEWASGRLFVRAHQDPYSLVPAIARTVHEMSADQPVERASTLSDIRAEVLTPDRLNAVVFGGFAAVALLISVVGVGGVLAFSVSGRTREFGIRMALGALPRNILAGVLTEGLAIAGIGVTAGIVTGFAFARILGKYVSEVQQPGALVFVASAIVILTAAVVASAVPAAARRKNQRSRSLTRRITPALFTSPRKAKACPVLKPQLHRGKGGKHEACASKQSPAFHLSESENSDGVRAAQSRRPRRWQAAPPQVVYTQIS